MEKEGYVSIQAVNDLFDAYKYLDGNDAIYRFKQWLDGQEPVRPMQKWIPVTERLPDKLQDVLVAFYDAPGEYDVAYMRKTFNATYKANGAENEWVSAMGETTYADYEVNAWMPIPTYNGG